MLSVGGNINKTDCKMIEFIKTNIEFLKIGVAIISIIINFFFFKNWLLRKLILGRFLEGRWEGVLLCMDDQKKLNQNVTLECSFIVTSHPKIENKGLLYYEQKRIQGNRNIKGALVNF